MRRGLVCGQRLAHTLHPADSAEVAGELSAQGHGPVKGIDGKTYSVTVSQ